MEHGGWWVKTAARAGKMDFRAIVDQARSRMEDRVDEEAAYVAEGQLQIRHPVKCFNSGGDGHLSRDCKVERISPAQHVTSFKRYLNVTRWRYFDVIFVRSQVDFVTLFCNDFVTLFCNDFVTLFCNGFVTSSRNGFVTAFGNGFVTLSCNGFVTSSGNGFVTAFGNGFVTDKNNVNITLSDNVL